MPATERGLLLERARALGATRRLVQCDALCRALLEQDPRDAPVLRLLAWAQYERGAAVDAERTARRWLALEPSSAEAHRALGRSLARQGRDEEAASPLRQCAALTRDDEDLARLARVLSSIPMHTREARELVATRAATAPCCDDARSVHQWLRAAVLLEESAFIQSFCSRLASLAPDDGALRASCAGAMLRVGDLRAAREHALSAIASSPNNVLAWSVRAAVCRASGRDDELHECERALLCARSASASHVSRDGANSTSSGSIDSIT